MASAEHNDLCLKAVKFLKNNGFAVSLARLNGTNEKSLVFPKAIGKSEMEKIAQQLADVRKKSYVSRT